MNNVIRMPVNLGDFPAVLGLFVFCVASVAVAKHIPVVKKYV